jgi:hypothetical protein
MKKLPLKSRLKNSKKIVVSAMPKKAYRKPVPQGLKAPSSKL